MALLEQSLHGHNTGQTGLLGPSPVVPFGRFFFILSGPWPFFARWLSVHVSASIKEGGQDLCLCSRLRAMHHGYTSLYPRTMLSADRQTDELPKRPNSSSFRDNKQPAQKAMHVKGPKTCKMHFAMQQLGRGRQNSEEKGGRGDL